VSSDLLVSKKSNLLRLEFATGIRNKVFEYGGHNERTGTELPKRERVSVKDCLPGALNKNETKILTQRRASKVMIDI
jgi:hypothetical protein